MANQENQNKSKVTHKGDKQAEQFGDAVIEGVKTVGMLGGLVGRYFKYSWHGIKKITLTGTKDKIFFVSWLSIQLVSINQILFSANYKFTPVAIIVFFGNFLFLNVLFKEKIVEDKIDYHPNDEFLDIYRKMGFKEDFEKGYYYPFLLGIDEQEKEVIYTFKANNNKLDNFQKNIDLLEETTNYKFSQVRKNEKNLGLIEVAFFNPHYKVEDERISIDDKNIDSEDTIKLNKNIVWNFRRDPHMFVNGGTGGGKTFFIFYIVKCLLEKKAILKIIDPKRSALYRLSDILGTDKVVCKKEDIVKLVHEAKNAMHKRAEELDNLRKQANDMTISKDYKDYALKPFFLIFDELMAFMAMADSKQGKAVMDDLTELITMGRELGVFVAILLQRGDTTSFKGALRDQMHARFVLGKVGDDGVKMAFGANYKLHSTTKEKGTGFIQIHTIPELENPIEFQSPYIHQNYTVLEEIQKIYKENYLLGESDPKDNKKIIQGKFNQEKLENNEDEEVTFEQLRKQKLEKNNNKKTSEN